MSIHWLKMRYLAALAMVFLVVSAAGADGSTTSVTADQVVVINPGTGHAISAHQKGSTGEVSAANLTSTNTKASTLQVSGVESGRGTIKVTHSPSSPGAKDANASGLSVYIAGSGAAAQGIHVDSDGTTGALLDIRNGGVQLVKVLADGSIQLGSSGPRIMTVKTGPPTVSAPNGSLCLGKDGTMWLRTSGSWVKK